MAIELKIKKTAGEDEWQVVYCSNGRRDPSLADCTYFTDDKEDAEGTLEAEILAIANGTNTACELADLVPAQRERALELMKVSGANKPDPRPNGDVSIDILEPKEGVFHVAAMVRGCTVSVYGYQGDCIEDADIERVCILQKIGAGADAKFKLEDLDLTTRIEACQCQEDAPAGSGPPPEIGSEDVPFPGPAPLEPEPKDNRQTPKREPLHGQLPPGDDAFLQTDYAAFIAKPKWRIARSFCLGEFQYWCVGEANGDEMNFQTYRAFLNPTMHRAFGKACIEVTPLAIYTDRVDRNPAPKNACRNN